MAKLVVMAVRDEAVGAFMRPMFVPSRGAAIRAFGDEVLRSESEMARHPEDYNLFELGSFEEESGQFHTVEVPVRVASGKDYVKQ